MSKKELKQLKASSKNKFEFAKTLKPQKAKKGRPDIKRRRPDIKRRRPDIKRRRPDIKRRKRPEIKRKVKH